MVDTQMDLTKLTATSYHRDMHEREFKMNRTVDLFCRKYEARMSVGTQLHRRYNSDAYTFDIHNTQFRDLYTTTYEVPMIRVDLPQDQLMKIIEMESDTTADSNFARYQDTERMYGEGWAETLVNTQRFESRVRSSNPAVKKAYEKYVMLLNMVKDEYR